MRIVVSEILIFYQVHSRISALMLDFTLNQNKIISNQNLDPSLSSLQAGFHSISFLEKFRIC